MSRQKLRIHNTPVDNLVSNLRGEVGETHTSSNATVSRRNRTMPLAIRNFLSNGRTSTGTAKLTPSIWLRCLGRGAFVNDRLRTDAGRL